MGGFFGNDCSCIWIILLLCCCCGDGFGSRGEGCDDGGFGGFGGGNFIWIILLLCCCCGGKGGFFGGGNCGPGCC